MPLFASRREKRLWIWTLLVIVAIFSTLGLARALAASLAETGVGAALFIVACLMVLAAVLTQGLTNRPSGPEIAVAIGIAAVYLLVFVRMSIPTERSHLIEYGIVAIFIYEALLERRRQGRGVPAPALLAMAVTSAIGAVDEGVQGLLPSRVASFLDVFFNTLASVMAVTASAALSWARRLAGRAQRRKS